MHAQEMPRAPSLCRRALVCGEEEEEVDAAAGATTEGVAVCAIDAAAEDVAAAMASGV
jgi:hypothetical protein